MKNKSEYKGFSLVEVLMAIGILSIGMLLIAAVFPAAIHFTTIATERTIASSVADEAFAKIRMYCTDPCGVFLPADVDVELTLFPEVQSPGLPDFNSVEFSYPSDDGVGVNRRMYSWSAVWRRLPTDLTGRSVQVTVFISRRVRAGTRYYVAGLDENEDGQWPIPLQVDVKAGSYQNEIAITEGPGSLKRNFINPGCTIVDERDGRIYRVRDRSIDNVVFLDSDWPLSQTTGTVWVVAPPVGGGRYPCIAVYQKVIRF